MDLSSLYNNGAGASASLMAGQQFADQRAASAEELRAKQLANQGTAAMNPLNAQFRQGQIDQQSAELPGILGDSQVKAAAGGEATALLPMKIASRFSQMATQIGADGMQQLGHDGEKLATIAAAIKQLPPMAQKDAFVKGYQAYGGNVNSPMIQAMLAAPDGQFQAAVEATGKGMALAGSKYSQQSALDKQGQDSHERIGNKNNATSIRVAEIQAASREAAAKARASAAKYMTSDQKLVMLNDLIAKGEATPEEVAEAKRISEQRLQERAASAPGVAPTVLNQPTPQQNAASTAGNIYNNVSAKPKPVIKASDFIEQAKKVWPNDDPSKYEYATDPASGRLMRKPK